MEDFRTVVCKVPSSFTNRQQPKKLPKPLFYTAFTLTYLTRRTSPTQIRSATSIHAVVRSARKKPPVIRDLGVPVTDTLARRVPWDCVAKTAASRVVLPAVV